MSSLTFFLPPRGINCTTMGEGGGDARKEIRGTENVSKLAKLLLYYLFSSVTCKMRTQISGKMAANLFIDRDRIIGQCTACTWHDLMEWTSVWRSFLLESRKNAWVFPAHVCNKGTVSRYPIKLSTLTLPFPFFKGTVFFNAKCRPNFNIYSTYRYLGTALLIYCWL